DSIDAKLTLTGPVRPDAPSGVRPEVTIALKGATDAPKRTLDATAFSNWLALRAVEQQSKRIDALEAGRDSREAPREQTPPKDSAVATTPPSAAPTPPSAQATRPPRQANQPPANQSPAAAPTTGSTRPRQPLDLQPPASGGR